ncbi:MAG: hypothetical protein AAB354_11180 [candidate division KSB1 bacterium]
MYRMKDIAKLLAVLLSVSCAEPAAAQDDLSALRALWNTAKYEEVVIKGSELREQPFGRTLELDYMLGTSLCRVPELQVDGIKFLAWCLSNYKMAEPDKVKIVQETEQCAQALAAPKPPPIAAATTRSSAGVSGKMYHYVSRDQALRTTTIKMVSPKTFEELRARLTPLEQADSAAHKIAKLAGSQFEIKTQGKFVIASANPNVDYEGVARSLNVYEKFFATAFGLKLPPYMITVYLTPDFRQYRELALKLHGFELPNASIGYSYREDLSLAALCPGRSTSTLYHELFHLMARSTFGDIPPWLDEGMAALYEVSKIEGERVLGLSNWRGQALNDLWWKRPNLEKLVKMNWVEFDQFEEEPSMEAVDQQAANHATARYFMQYLQEHNQLVEVFNAFRTRNPKALKTTPQAETQAVLETILQKPMTEVDKDFATWFKAEKRWP